MKHLLIPIMAFLVAIKPLLLLVGIFIIIDTGFGLWKSKKLKVPISSRAFSAIVTKMFLYQGAIILLYAMEHFILGDIVAMFFSGVTLLLTKVAATVLIGIELGSINENFKKVKGYSIWFKAKEFLTRAKIEADELMDAAQETKDKAKDLMKD